MGASGGPAAGSHLASGTAGGLSERRIDDRNRPFWSELAWADQRELLRLGAIRSFPAGTALLRENDPSSHVLVLRRGCVKVVSRGDDGCNVVLGIRDAGEIIGEMSSMAGEPRSASVYAINEVEALVVPAGWFNAFVRARRDAEVALRGSLCTRLRESDRCRRAATGRVERRLAAVLLDLAERYGAPDLPDGSVLIDLPLSQEDIAGLALTSRRTLGRILMRLRNEQVLVTGLRTILVKSPATLREWLAGEPDGQAPVDAATLERSGE